MPRKSAAKAKSLTARDMAILTNLARCRVLSLAQVKGAYWASAKERTCRERLDQLEKAGYIASQTAQGDQPGIGIEVYHLDSKGKKWAIGPEGPGLDRSIVFETAGKSNEIVHQIRTNDLYFALSEQKKSTWRNGDALEIEQGVHDAYHHGNAAIPDASYTDDSGTEIYIETDIGQYTKKQIEAKVAAFSGKKTIWVCPAGRDRTLRRHGVAGEIRTYKPGGDR